MIADDMYNDINAKARILQDELAFSNKDKLRAQEQAEMYRGMYEAARTDLFKALHTLSFLGHAPSRADLRDAATTLQATAYEDYDLDPMGSPAWIVGEWLEKLAEVLSK